MIYEDGVEEETMQTHPSKDTICLQGFNCKIVDAVDLWRARYPVSLQAHLRLSGFDDSSNLRMWFSAFASTTAFAPSTHRAI
jgi:hypothetical protein